MRQSPATSRCAHWWHGSAWSHSSCSLLEQVLVITHRRSCAILITQHQEGRVHMDWNLSAFQPLSAASVVLPAGGNMEGDGYMGPENQKGLFIPAIPGGKPSLLWGV